MIIECTPEQLLQMGKLAILASYPVGMGFRQHKPDLTTEEIDLTDHYSDRGLFIDYYMGRMVKFRSYKTDTGYSFPDKIRSEYESWIHTYPSYQALYDAVKNAQTAQ